MLLVGDLAVELVPVALLFFEERVAPGLEGGKALLDPPRDTAIEPDGGLRQGGEKASVVADENECAAHGLQFRFEPFDGRQVEMVGGLVEQQDVGLGCQRLRQGHAPPLPARQARRVLGAGQA